MESVAVKRKVPFEGLPPVAGKAELRSFQGDTDRRRGREREREREREEREGGSSRPSQERSFLSRRLPTRAPRRVPHPPLPPPPTCSPPRRSENRPRRPQRRSSSRGQIGRARRPRSPPSPPSPPRPLQTPRLLANELLALYRPINCWCARARARGPVEAPPRPLQTSAPRRRFALLANKLSVRARACGPQL